MALCNYSRPAVVMLSEWADPITDLASYQLMSTRVSTAPNVHSKFPIASIDAIIGF
jgi:hypothetical protein